MAHVQKIIHTADLDPTLPAHIDSYYRITILFISLSTISICAIILQIVTISLRRKGCSGAKSKLWWTSKTTKNFSRCRFNRLHLIKVSVPAKIFWSEKFALTCLESPWERNLSKLLLKQKLYPLDKSLNEVDLQKVKRPW